MHAGQGQGPAPHLAHNRCSINMLIFSGFSSSSSSLVFNFLISMTTPFFLILSSTMFSWALLVSELPLAQVSFPKKQAFGEICWRTFTGASHDVIVYFLSWGFGGIVLFLIFLMYIYF